MEAMETQKGRFVAVPQHQLFPDGILNISLPQRAQQRTYKNKICCLHAIPSSWPPESFFHSFSIRSKTVVLDARHTNRVQQSHTALLGLRLVERDAWRYAFFSVPLSWFIRVQLEPCRKRSGPQ